MVFSNIENKKNPAAIGSLDSYVRIMAPKKRRFVQMSVDAPIKNWQQVDVRVSKNTRLQMDIADLVHSDGNAFSLPKSNRFTTVLRLAKTVGPDFNVPGRNQISGILLDRNFKSCWEANRDALLLKSSIFGLAILGDGATLSRTPFINILVMCGDTPPVVIGIHDCTKNLIEGGKKDAPYIAEMHQDTNLPSVS